MAVTGTTVPPSETENETAALPPLFEALPTPWAERFDPLAPWALLGAALDEVLAALPSEHIDGALAPEVSLAGDRIVIGRGTRVHPHVVIEGPCWIGQDVEIRPGAYIRGGVWIGDGCVVGASSEVKCSILLPHAKAPHLNYVGDSILGAGVNLGAGTVLSNFRHDGREVRIPGNGAGPLPTGRRKLGAILGDGVAEHGAELSATGRERAVAVAHADLAAVVADVGEDRAGAEVHAGA